MASPRNAHLHCTARVGDAHLGVDEVVQGQIGWQTWKVSAMTAREKRFRMSRMPVQNIEQGFTGMQRALAKLFYGANVGVQCCSVRGELEEWQ